MTQDQLINSQSLSSQMGKKGEAFALMFERKRLQDYQHGKIVHFQEKEIALGYDILSCEDKDSILPDRYIEVKTFRGHKHFYWSVNEIITAQKYGEKYYLYLIDYERINDSDYEPEMIQNPAFIFNADALLSTPPTVRTAAGKNIEWIIQPQSYLISLVSNEQIPDDWNDSTILLGCYNSEDHLKWILNNKLYNVRAGKNVPGAVMLNPLNTKARYLVLYSSASANVYSIYALSGAPKRVSRADLQVKKYPNPHDSAYLLHTISHYIESFHINLSPILNEANHTPDRPYGTPLYVAGIQLRRFMKKAEDEEPVDASSSNNYSDMVSYMDFLAPGKSMPKKTAHRTPEYIREQKFLYKNAYEPWTSSLDQKLLQLYNIGTPIEQLMKIFQRNHGSIVSRIKKLCQKKQ